MDRRKKENSEKIKLAYRAIDYNVGNSISRWIIKYVLSCECHGQLIIRPSNEHLIKKYNKETGGHVSEQVLSNSIYKAKKSKFIITTGRGRNRCFEIDFGFLLEKMEEILAEEREVLNRMDKNKELFFDNFN